MRELSQQHHDDEDGPRAALGAADPGDQRGRPVDPGRPRTERESFALAHLQV